ncbi:hypothetical protein BGX38DRAFT_1281492 [Terfezia claveryi]|nr:hypothetical protein BGX38DRAFT_1281492 [Terfezia claveryi]
MLPRPPLISSGLRLLASPARLASSSPIIARCAFSTQPRRAGNILSLLHDFNDAYKKLIRRGRGPSSGKGKTSGRGHKGQGQHGGVPAGMNGGQTKDEVVAGPYGFKNQ